jgi:hypothetical protein
MFFLWMHKERTKESAPRSITLPSASARYTSSPATASAKVRTLRGQHPTLCQIHTDKFFKNKLYFSATLTIFAS